MNRILLIEPDTRLAQRLQQRLRAEGYAVRLAEDGRSGLRLARQGRDDLVLLDVDAPVMCGFEVLERLRALGRAEPVILLGADKDRVRGLGLGADDYLTRPLGLAELLARIRARTGAARRVSALNGAIHGEGLASIADKAIELTNAERALILLRNGKPDLRVVVARARDGRNLPPEVKYSTSITQHVLKSGKAQALVDPGEAEGWAGGSVVELRLRHVLCAPLESGGQRLGTLYADSKVSAPGFTQADLEVFQTLAHQCAERIAKHRMRDSLREARDMQRALIPRRPDSGRHLQVAGLSRPLEEAGGDYIDYIRLSPQRLAIAMGDVAGHGVAAALVMTAARSLLRAFLPREADAAATLAQVNRALVRDMPPGSFMSMFVGELNTETGRLRYASAGHNEALLLRAIDGRFDELAPTGAALGVVESEAYELAETAPLRADDVLLLYTDGLTEAMNGAHEMFGMDRLKQLVRGLRERTAPEIVSGIVAAVTRFAGRQGPDDDCSLIVVKGTAAATG